MPAFKLKEVKDPVFELDLGDGEIKKYDPWVVSEKIDEPVKNSDGSTASQYDSIRVAFGFPTEEQVANAQEGQKPYTPSRNACVVMQAELLGFIAGLEPVKKLENLRQKR